MILSHEFASDFLSFDFPIPSNSLLGLGNCEAKKCGPQKTIDFFPTEGKSIHTKKNLKMQVIDANNGVLTNTEVMELLLERKQQRIQHLQQLQQSGTPSQISHERAKIDSQQHRVAIENKVIILVIPNHYV